MVSEHDSDFAAGVPALIEYLAPKDPDACTLAHGCPPPKLMRKLLLSIHLIGQDPHLTCAETAGQFLIQLPASVFPFI